MKVIALVIFMAGTLFFTNHYLSAIGRERNFKGKIGTLVISFVGTLFFTYEYYLTGFAAGYGIKEADRNLVLLRCGAVICGLVFLSCGISLLWEMIRRRRGQSTSG
jgi:drug/metabolite transporter (DMT)-like permease